MLNFADLEPIFANDGYRPNVGIVLSNGAGQVFWARRTGHDGWQFPQGGMKRKESPRDAMYRELEEETGLLPEHVEILAHTASWLHYDLPKRFLARRYPSRCRRNITPFRGQKQIWFLLKMVHDDSVFNLKAAPVPEFDKWKWVDYWQVLDEIVEFKRDVYKMALKELERYLPTR
jgi:putative (di)nucleoside polyphosphate hydrolase